MSVGEALVPLTDREREIAALIATGRSRKKIARELHISPYTVNGHCDAISSKLNGVGRFAVRCTTYWLAAHSESSPS